MLAKLIQFLDTLHGWMDLHPIASAFAFIGFFMAVQLVMFPVSPLGMAAGLFFGFWKGFVVLMAGCAAGATLNFFLVRWVARDYVRRKLQHHRAFQMIDIAVAREGWRIVALLRFVPIPFGLANYCYGLTPIPYIPYILATCVAIIPADSFFVWIGSPFHATGGTLADVIYHHKQNPMEYIFMGLGAIAFFLVLRLVSKAAKAHIERDVALGRPTDEPPRP